MKSYQPIISDTPTLSAQNCKLRVSMEVFAGKANISSHHNHPLDFSQISSGTVYFEEQLLKQIPGIQNSLHTMGSRIRGLSIKGACNQYNLTS